METLPEFLRNSITWDQGKEMARHAEFTVRTGLPIYCCDPHSPIETARSSARVGRSGDHVLAVREAVPPVPSEPVWVGQVHIAADLRSRSLTRGWDGILRVSQPFHPLGHRPR